MLGFCAVIIADVVLAVTVGVVYCSFCGCVTSLLGLGGLDLVSFLIYCWWSLSDVLLSWVRLLLGVGWDCGLRCLHVNSVGLIISLWVCLGCLVGLLWLRDLYYFAGCLCFWLLLCMFYSCLCCGCCVGGG